MPEFNVDLAVRVLVEIEKDVRGLRADGLSWDQMDWAEPTECGTAYCFGGWTAHLRGWDKERVVDKLGVDEVLHWLGATDAERVVAGERIGLFRWSNTLDDLYAWCADAADLSVAEMRGKVAAEGRWAA